MEKQVNMPLNYWEDLVKTLKLYAHARSCQKIGSKAESIAFFAKADEMAIRWFRSISLVRR